MKNENKSINQEVKPCPKCKCKTVNPVFTGAGVRKRYSYQCNKCGHEALTKSGKGYVVRLSALQSWNRQKR